MAKERHREKERQKGRNTQPPFNPSVGSLCHFCVTPTHLSYRFSIFETSATALCGTTGIYIYNENCMLYCIYTLVCLNGMQFNLLVLHLTATMTSIGLGFIPSWVSHLVSHVFLFSLSSTLHECPSLFREFRDAFPRKHEVFRCHVSQNWLKTQT